MLGTVGSSSSHTEWQDPGVVIVNKWRIHLMSMPSRED